MTKLTLSVTEEDVRKAKELAARDGVSVSSMFRRMVRARAQDRQRRPKYRVPISPAVKALSGIIKLPEGMSDEDAIAEAIMEHHGLK